MDKLQIGRAADAWALRTFWGRRAYLWNGWSEDVRGAQEYLPGDPLPEDACLHYVPDGKPWRTHYTMSEPVPHYSTSIAAAWNLLIHVCNLGHFEPTLFHDRTWGCSLRQRGTGAVVSEMCQQGADLDAPELAILRAVQAALPLIDPERLPKQPRSTRKAAAGAGGTG